MQRGSNPPSLRLSCALLLLAFCGLSFAVPARADSVSTIYDVTGEITLKGPSATETISNISFQAEWTFLSSAYWITVVPGSMSFTQSGPLDFTSSGLGAILDGYFGFYGQGDEIDIRWNAPGNPILYATGAIGPDLPTPGFFADVFSCQSAACKSDFPADVGFAGTGAGLTDSFTVTTVPEPSTALLLLTGLAMFGCYRKSKRSGVTSR